MYKDIIKDFEVDFDAFCSHHDIDYSIAYDELDYYPRGYVFKKNNGRYHIVLNGKHDIKQLQKTCIHEITHIIYNHLDMNCLFKDFCESEADKVANELNLVLAQI